MTFCPHCREPLPAQLNKGYARRTRTFRELDRWQQRASLGAVARLLNAMRRSYRESWQAESGVITPGMRPSSFIRFPFQMLVTLKEDVNHPVADDQEPLERAFRRRRYP